MKVMVTPIVIGAVRTIHERRDKETGRDRN